MKRALLITLLLSFVFCTNAQIRVHSNGRISLKTTGTSGGIQINPNGLFSFEPERTGAYLRINQTYSDNSLSKSWIVKSKTTYTGIGNDVFYVTGNGVAYSRGYYTMSPVYDKKSGEHISDALKMLSEVNGYYYKNHDFDGCDGIYEGNENVHPDAIPGLLEDLKVGRCIGLDIQEVEKVLPEVVRHGPECEEYISYSSLVPVLIEAIKEQQAQIDMMRSVLKENGIIK